MINNDWQALGVRLMDTREIARIVTSNSVRIDLPMWLPSNALCVVTCVEWLALSSHTISLFSNDHQCLPGDKSIQECLKECCPHMTTVQCVCTTIKLNGFLDVH